MIRTKVNSNKLMEDTQIHISQANYVAENDLGYKYDNDVLPDI